MMNSKKAEMGVGTLIVFIAMLLVAAVAAGVLIQTAGSLQEQSLATGQQARSQISTNARVIEVSATDGRNGNLTDFQQIVKLSPGSDPIKLDQIIFTFNTKDETSTLKYRGEDSVCEQNNVDGYNTLTFEQFDEINTSVNQIALAEDLDDDQQTDYLYIMSPDNLTYVFNFSAAGVVYVNTGDNLSDASTTPVDVSATATLRNGTGQSAITLGYLTISGTTNTNDTIDAAVSVRLDPYDYGEGYFAVVYEQTGTNHVPGNLQRGDVIRLCYEAPGEIVEDEEVRLNFIPKIGTATLTKFVSPDVISTERVYLYP